MALSQIRSRGVLKVGTTGDYMPMSFLDPASGDYIGMDADLARARMGIMMPKGSEDLLAYVNSFLREYERDKKAPLTGRNL